MHSQLIHRSGALVAAIFVASVRLGAQDPPRFTVASIRPSADNEPGMTVQALPNSGYAARKVPLLALVTSAYGLSPARIIGLPQWPDRYDVQARYEPSDATAPAPPLGALLQSLLRDRFGLRAHVEQRDMPVYLLTIARGDGRLGPRLARSSAPCGDATAVARAREAKLLAGNGAPACAMNEGPGVLTAGGMPMESIARALRVPAQREIVDRTGLAGLWEASLEFAMPGETTTDTPGLFTAIQEQFGLRLEPARAPLDVLVIDAISQPTLD